MIQKFQNDNIPKGLLALAPFFLGITSLFIGFSAALIVFVFLLFLAPMNYFLRKLIPPEQRLVFILIISVSWMIIIRMFLEAEVYSLAEKIGLFLPLLLINSMVLSITETVYSMPDFKSVMRDLFYVGIAILLFFMLFGLLRELLNNFSILASPAGCFFLSGFLFSIINYSNRKILKH
jgi:H+/Na+-translocating ferredoxin:NAD+ oxidoreductase subunit E